LKSLPLYSKILAIISIVWYYKN